MSPRHRGVAGILALLVVLSAAAGIWLHRTLTADRVPLGDPVFVEIPRGTSLRAAAQILAEAGLLDAPWKLRAVSRLKGGDRSLRAGHYELPAGLSPASLLDELVEGAVLTVDVTLLEGWNVAQMAQVLADSLDLDVDALTALVKSPPEAWRENLDLPEGADLEGYLFPETYRFILGLTPQSVVQTLLLGLEAAWTDSVARRAEERGMSRHEVLTLASIVEAEAQQAAERPQVAAVYLNRLARGMRLEADPTVAYAMGISGEELTYRHLRAESPYNTYRNAGLPPGPINCPGRAAIHAVLWPQPGFEALYFVSDGAGGHRFSRTWTEHVEAVQEYRAIQRRRRVEDDPNEAP